MRPVDWDVGGSFGLSADYEFNAVGVRKHYPRLFKQEFGMRAFGLSKIVIGRTVQVPATFLAGSFREISGNIARLNFYRFACKFNDYHTFTLSG